MLKATKINKSFKEGTTKHPVLIDLDLNAEPGEFVAIMGASGSGKSTLLHILGLLDSPDSGQVIINGKDTARINNRAKDKIRNQETGFVFQFYHLLPELNALENIMLPIMIKCPAWRWTIEKPKAIKRASELIELVGLSGHAKQKVTTMSGGERQRIALARSLANNPRLLLADEPTGNLDSKSGAAILDILHNLNKNGQTIVMVTHDLNIAQQAHRVISLIDGKFQ